MAYHDPCRRLRVSVAGHHTRGASLPTDNSLNDRRLHNWCQTPQTRIPDPAAAASLIERVGIATLYPVSPEVPNLFHAFLGDAEAKTDSAWDTPSGQVYAWRWDLGRLGAGFYTAIVRGRPTFVSWDLLPALLRLRGELRTSDELYDLGALSEGAYRIVQALEQSEGVLGTSELRQAANFPTGKEYRAAYLKAVEELDTRLILAKIFSPDDTDMRHALVAARYRRQVDEAEALSEDDALDRVLLTYAPPAVYVVPTVLARHLKLAEDRLIAALERFRARGLMRSDLAAGHKGDVYIWESEHVDLATSAT
jgi:hypothetical protein